MTVVTLFVEWTNKSYFPVFCMALSNALFALISWRFILFLRKCSEPEEALVIEYLRTTLAATEKLDRPAA